MNPLIRYATADWVISLFLSLAALGLFFPGQIGAGFVAAAVLIAILKRDEIQIDASIKQIGWMFLAFILIFALTAENFAPARKGLYDILRGLLFFPLGILLGKQLDQSNRNILIVLVLALVALALNLFEKQPSGFYGFYVNSNSTAFSLVVPLCFLIPMLLVRKNKPAFVIAAVGIALGGYLLFLTNSRSAILGLFLATLVLLLRYSSKQRGQRTFMGIGAMAVFIWFLAVENRKGFQLSLRDEIWQGTIQATITHHPWLGYGLNNGKELLKTIFPTAFVHNLGVDIFISTGVIGFVFFVALTAKLILTFWRWDYKRNFAYAAGLTGLVCFLTIAMFDLRFASVTFIGIVSFFLGLLYSSRLEKR